MRFSSPASLYVSDWRKFWLFKNSIIWQNLARRIFILKLQLCSFFITLLFYVSPHHQRFFNHGLLSLKLSRTQRSQGHLFTVKLWSETAGVALLARLPVFQLQQRKFLNKFKQYRKIHVDISGIKYCKKGIVRHVGCHGQGSRNSSVRCLDLVKLPH